MQATMLPRASNVFPGSLMTTYMIWQFITEYILVGLQDGSTLITVFTNSSGLICDLFHL